MTEFKFELGEKVRDKVSGFKGTIIQRTEFLNGCIQYGVQPQGLDKDGKIRDAMGIDEQSIELIEKKKSPFEFKKRNGGPYRLAFKSRGY